MNPIQQLTFELNQVAADLETAVNKLNDLQESFDTLADLYYRTNLPDKYVFDKDVEISGRLILKRPLVLNGGLTFPDAGNVTFGTTTGSKIGTTATEKFAFWGATPIIRPAAITAPTGGATIDAEARTAINTIRTRLTTLGLTA